MINWQPRKPQTAIYGRDRIIEADYYMLKVKFSDFY